MFARLCKASTAAREVGRHLRKEGLFIGNVKIANGSGLVLPASHFDSCLRRRRHNLTHQECLLRGLYGEEGGLHMVNVVNHFACDAVFHGFEAKARQILARPEREKLQ
jgi:hypothetical protein